MDAEARDPPPPADVQRATISDLWAAHNDPTKAEIGSTWYVIDAKWFDTWRAFAWGECDRPDAGSS